MTKLEANTSCVAHRGNSEYFFQNSLSSLKSAYEIGSDGIEFDVVHTQDDKGIVFHDKTLHRLAKDKPSRDCPRRKLIKHLSLKEIKENCLLKNDEEIPTLDEVLTYFIYKDVTLFIEFKDVPSFSTVTLISEHLTYNPAKYLRLISFKKKALEYAQQVPRLKKVKALRLYHHWCPKIKKSSYGADIKWFKGILKKLAKLKNVETSVYTINSPKKMQKLIDEGVDYITTDDPQACLKLTKP